MNNFDKWLTGEKNWIDEIDRKIKKQAWLYALLSVAACVVILGAIGLFAGGTIDVQAMLQNMLIGLAFGIFAALFLPLLVRHPAKRYNKGLKSEIEDVLSAQEKEEFAEQMQGTEVKCISWTGDEKTENRVLVSRDYVVFLSGLGSVCMVQLQKVKKIVTDVREFTVTVRGNGFKTEHTAVAYPIYFYYQTPAEGEKKNCDKEIDFDSRQIREELSHYLHEMQIGEWEEKSI